MRYFETPKMNISMFDSLIATGETPVTESIVQPTMTAIAEFTGDDALVGRTSFNALMQVQK